jgi:tetratricopeptide (TPR) repeat protein
MELAIDHLEQAISIAQETRRRRIRAEALNNLGDAYRRLEQVEKAADYHKQALEIAREINARFEEGYILDNLGLAHAKLGDIDRAIECHGQALQIAREIENRHGEAQSAWHLGLLHETSDPARATELMQIRVDYEREIGHVDAEEHAEHVRGLLN